MTTRSKAEASALVAQLHAIQQHADRLHEAHGAEARRLALGTLENSVEELLITVRIMLDESPLGSLAQKEKPDLRSG